MDMLKLVALDAEDLRVVSAHVQDAVLKVGDLEFRNAAKQFVVPMYRFAWEKEGRAADAERRNSVLHFDRVLFVKSTAIPRDKPETVLSLLAVEFSPRDLPAGAIDLIFSGGGTIRLEVECVEARLTDLGGAWQALARPEHRG